MAKSEKDKTSLSEDEFSKQFHYEANSDRRFADVVNFLPDPTFVIDKEGIVIAWNRAIEDLTGITAQDILGKGNCEYAVPFYGVKRPVLVDLVFHQDLKLESEYNSLQRDGMNLTGELFLPFFGKNGSYIWAKAAPLYDDSGNIIGAVESLRDITERKEAEEALKESEAKFRLLFERSADAMFLLDGEKFIDCNRAAMDMMKCTTKQELLNLHPSQTAPDRQPDGSLSFEKAEEMMRIAFEKGTHRFEWVRRRTNAEEFPVEVTLTAIPWKGKQILHVVVKDITEQKLAEKALKESENKYRTIFENTCAATVILEEDTIVSLANAEFEKLTGYSKGEIEGKKSWTEFVETEDLEKMIKMHRLRRENQDLSPKSYEFRLTDKRGQIKDILLTVDMIPGTKKSVASLLDISKRKQAEIAYQENLRFLQNLIDAIPNSIFYKDTKGIYQGCNSALEKFLGLSKEDIIGKSVYDLYSIDLADSYNKMDQALFAKPGSKVYESSLHYVDGTMHDVIFNKATYTDANGRLSGLVGIVLDITKRKRAEEALRASHQIIEGIINAIPVRVFWKDRNLVYLGCNAIFAHDAGFADPKDVVGKDDYQMGWRDQAELYRSDDCQVIESGRPKLLIEEPQTTPEGNTIVLLTSKIPLRSSEGKIIGVLGTYMDITERKRTEEALQESEERFKAQYQGSPAPTFTWQKHGADFVLVDFNEAAKAITDGKVTEFVGLKASELYADRPEILRDLLRCHDEREVIKREIRSQNFVPGALVVTTFASVPPDLVLVHLEDISERKRMEKDLNRSRDDLKQRVRARTADLEAKNAEMERFIYTVSHDLRTPLISMSGFLGFLKADAEKGDMKRLDADLRIVSDAVTKMDRLLLETLELSRIGRIISPPENVPFREIVSEALAQSSAKMSSKNVLVTVEEDLPIVQVDRMKLVEVLVNLFENSVKYMGDQPQPEIAIGKRLDGENTVFFVRDNGIGIDPSQHDKVFELFYKVDKKSKGSGAGLAIVKKIIEVHRGSIWVESGLGKGCTVCFTIPHAQDIIEP